MKEDHCSYRSNFCSCEKKKSEKIQAFTGFEPLPLCDTGFRLSFCNCKSCVYDCDDLLSYTGNNDYAIIITIMILVMIIVNIIILKS